MNPFYEHFKVECLGGAGVDTSDLGPFYKGVLFQRGYGLTYRELPTCQAYGLGLGETMSNLFYAALPMLKRGLRYLGSKAVRTAANIAEEAIRGRNIGEATKEHATEAVKDIWAKAPPEIVERLNKTVTAGNTADSPQPSVRRKRRPVGTLAGKGPKIKRRKTRFGAELKSTYPLLGKL